MNKIMLIKTNKCCFISDCFAKEKSYDYKYHNSIITNLLFDGEKATETWGKHWYRISKYPSNIEIEIPPEAINERYEIKDTDNVSKKLIKIIKYENRDDYDYEVLESLYELKYEMSLPGKKKYDVEIETVCEIDNFIDACDFSYKATKNINFEDRVYTITNADIEHSMLDKIIIPDVLLTNRPCRFTSKQMYDITRQYVKEHIDSKMARITSDYDFCFTVKKIVPLLEPKEIAYSHIFARTKRERTKIHYRTASVKEFDILSMTHDQENYKGYTAIEGIFANSESELKKKIDLWLESLIEIINKPLCQCEHCKGTGYVGESSRVNKNEMITKINNGDDLDG